MPSAVTVKAVPTFRDLAGRFARANRKLLEIRREEMRIQARRLVGLTKDEAPKGRTGAFREGISYQTFVEGGAVGLRITTPQPLGTFIVEGTRPHTIRPRSAQVLAFPWASGPFGVAGMGGTGLHFFPVVHHPGTSPNRFPGRAYRRWLPGARETLARISTRYVREIQGSV